MSETRRPLYVVVCKDGSPCKVDMGSGSTLSPYIPAEGPYWELEKALRVMDDLESNAMKAHKCSPVICGPHAVVEYKPAAKWVADLKKAPDQAAVEGAE